MANNEKTPQGALRQAFSAVHLDAETRTRHLHRLRHRAASRPSARPAATAAPRLRGLRLRLAAVASAVLLSLGGGAGVAVASTGALPGDGLYRVKVALEQVQLRLSPDSETAVQRGLEMAERRLAEIAALHELGRYERLAQALARHEARLAMTGQEAAGDPVLEAAVQQAGARAVERLTELLEGDLPDEASERAREALETARDRIADEEAESTGSPAPAAESGPPAEPGPPGEPGPPADPGPPPHAQQPADAGPRADGRRQDVEQRSETRSGPEARPGGDTPPSPPGSRAPRASPGPRS